MAKHRSHSIEFKRQFVQAYLAGEALHGLTAVAACNTTPRGHDLRADTVATSGMFRLTFARRQGIAPADALYEWQGAEAGKQPTIPRQPNPHNDCTFEGTLARPWEDHGKTVGRRCRGVCGGTGGLTLLAAC